MTGSKTKTTPCDVPSKPKEFSSMGSKLVLCRGQQDLPVSKSTSIALLRAREKWGVVPHVLEASAMSWIPSSSLDVVLWSPGFGLKQRDWCEKRQGTGFKIWSQKKHGSSPFLVLTSHVTSGQPCRLSTPQFPSSRRDNETLRGMFDHSSTIYNSHVLEAT